MNLVLLLFILVSSGSLGVVVASDELTEKIKNLEAENQACWNRAFTIGQILLDVTCLLYTSDAADE